MVQIFKTQFSKTLCVVAAFCMGSAALAENSGWRISEADGQVSVIRGEKSLYGAEGTELQVGDLVKTSNAANAVLVRGDNFVVIEPGKTVRIKPAEEQGMFSQMVEYVSGLLGPSEDRSKLKRPLQAAVVKGLDGEMMTTPANPQTSEQGSER